MKPTTLAALLLLPTAAHTADFNTRIAHAKSVIATPAGHAYDLALVPAVHAAMTKCVPPGRSAASPSDSFTTVASVATDGRVRDVQVRPATALSRCFARELGALRLQPPPKARRAGDLHPILIEIRDRF